jgi:uncharacterized repeat protein (TIGR01451 family)
MPPAVPARPPGPVDPPVPQVALHVRVPARAEPDKDLTYHLTVENTSRAAAHHVLVRDRLPAGTRVVSADPPAKAPAAEPAKGKPADLTWDLGTLEPAERREIVLVIHPPDAEEIENSAYVQFEHGQTVRTKTTRPVLAVRATAPARAALYDPVTFRLEVSNTGTVPARDVVVTDELPAGLDFVKGKPEPRPDRPLTWKLGDLGPGKTAQVEYEALCKETGEHSNRVQVTAAGGVRRQTSCSVRVGEPKLTVTKTGPQQRLVNRPATYHITVSNPGTMPVGGVQVSDEIPAGIEFLRASPPGQVGGGYVRWSVGSLPPGEQRTLQVVVRAPKPGHFTNVAEATAERNLSARAAAQTHFEVGAGPAVEIDGGEGPLDVGRRVKYTIRLLNAGSNAALHPALVITVPSQMKVIGSLGPTTAHTEGQTVRFDALNALEPNAERLYTVEVEALTPGEASLRVELTDGRAGPSPRWEEKVTIREPARPGGRDVQTGRKSTR